MKDGADTGLAVGRWRYRAAAADGAAVRGEIDAPSERDAVDALRRRSLWVVDLQPVTRARAAVDRSTASDFTGSGARVAASPARSLRDVLSWSGPDTELAVVIRSMATLLSAGVPLYRTLAYAAQEATTERARLTFVAVRDGVERGDALSHAVAGQALFPSIFAPIIAAGENTGTLDTSLSLLADLLERRAALRTRLQSALIYPAILGIASVIGVVVILLVVVPRFADLIADGGGTLPVSTRALIAVSTALTQGWPVVLVLLVLLVVGARVALQSPSTRLRLHASRLTWPVVGRLERLQAATGYAGTLAIALRAGVSLLGGMALARAVVANDHVAAALQEAEDRVRAGASLSSAVSGVLSPLTERLLDAGETSGDLSGMSARAAEASDAELQRTIGRAVALIEPVMILGFGGVVGFVALALLQAIYGLNASTL